MQSAKLTIRVEIKTGHAGLTPFALLGLLVAPPKGGEAAHALKGACGDGSHGPQEREEKPAWTISRSLLEQGADKAGTQRVAGPVCRVQERSLFVAPDTDTTKAQVPVLVPGPVPVPVGRAQVPGLVVKRAPAQGPRPVSSLCRPQPVKPSFNMLVYTIRQLQSVEHLALSELPQTLSEAETEAQAHKALLSDVKLLQASRVI